MAEYIEREALKRAIRKAFHDLGVRIDINSVINAQPTADVVEVVRCKDCEFWQTDWIPNHGGDQGCHYCEMMDTFTEPLNYCGYGERKILPKD